MPPWADEDTVKGSARHLAAPGAWLAGTAVLSLVQPLSAQPRTTPGERVEQGIGDVGPSSIGTRVAPADLRHPLGFDAVYRLGEARVFGHGEQGLLARVSGATWAVFPRSVYASTPGGLVAPIPPGTVFHIGGIPEAVGTERPRSMLGADLSPQSLTRLDLGAAWSAPARAALDAVPAGPSSIFASEAFRRSRMEEILAGACGVTGDTRSR